MPEHMHVSHALTPAQSPFVGVSAALAKLMVTNVATQAEHGNGWLGES